MSSPIDRIVALKTEIANLEFQKEIFMHSECKLDIDDILNEIDTRDTQLAELRSHLDELVSAQPATEGIGSAICNQQTRPLISGLPYEMLSAVFNEGPMVPSMRMAFALSVSQVSRYWRETAMQTPFLWSGIYLLPWHTGIGYQKFLELLVQRSQSHPLEIAAKLADLDNPHNIVNKIMAISHQTRRSQSFPISVPVSLQRPPTKHHLQAQLDTVIPEVSRWRSFTYECDHPGEISEITERLTDLSAPILESFDLAVTFRELNAYVCEARNIFEGGAPVLSKVRIGGIEPIACLPPLSFVTSLRLEEGTEQMGGAEFLHMLRSLPTLVSLHLEGTVVETVDLYGLALQGRNVELDALRSFSFSANASPKYCIDGILNTIRCPGLKSLTISNLDAWGGVQPLELSSTEALPIPPFLNLRSVKLSGIECDKFVAHFDLTHLPALDIISLTNCTSPMSFLRLLLPFQGWDNGECVWPVLRVIALGHVGLKEFDGLYKIVSHRRACDKPIETVVFDSASMKNYPEKVQRLKQHVSVQRGESVYYLPHLDFFPCKSDQTTP